MGGLCPSISCGSRLNGPAAMLAQHTVLTGHTPEIGPVHGGLTSVDLSACQYGMATAMVYLGGSANCVHCSTLPVGLQGLSCICLVQACLAPVHVRTCTAGIRHADYIMHSAQHELSS